MNSFKKLLLGLGLHLLTVASHADYATSLLGTGVTGLNVYAPFVLYDQQESLYKMWYGGWQYSRQYGHDTIYYATSTDGITFTNQRISLLPYGIGYHVNDPTVTKIYNTANNT